MSVGLSASPLGLRPAFSRRAKMNASMGDFTQDWVVAGTDGLAGLLDGGQRVALGLRLGQGARHGQEQRNGRDGVGQAQPSGHGRVFRVSAEPQI